MTSRLSSSRLHARLEPSGKHQPQHSEITDQRPERMSERRRLVSLDQEVPDPGKGVGHHRPQQRIPGMASCESHNQRTKPQQSANCMHRPITSVAVLMQVESEEVFITGKFLWRHLYVLIVGRCRGNGQELDG